MSTIPKISVLVPSYNAADYLPKMIQSVVAQTFANWEMVIVDDGSSDGTSNILDVLLARFSGHRISTTTIPHVGCAGALKLAVELSIAPLCTFVGADDQLTPNSLEVIVRGFAENPEVGFIWTRYLKKGPNGKSWKDGRSKELPPDMPLKEALLSGWWGALAQDSFRRSVYERTAGLDPGLPFAVDQQLASLFAQLECPAMHLPTVTYLHFQHPKQMSATHYKQQQQCRAEILKRLGGKYVRET